MNYPFYPAHSSNYSKGRGSHAIRFVTIHHIGGTPSTLRHLWGNPDRNGSSHYGVFPTGIEQYVREADTAWTNGNFTSNQQSITVENYGDWRNGWTNQATLNNLRKLLTDIHRRYPNIQINYHNDISATACPAQLKGHAQKIWNEIKQGVSMNRIPDDANHYGRYGQRVAQQIRGRTLSRGEFTKHIAGQTHLRALEILSDNVEADRNTEDAVLGKKARTEGWQAQISDLKATNKELTKALAIKDKEIAKLEAELALVGDDTKNLNAFGEMLRWFVARMGFKK
jgi:hypothetical protein